MGRSWARVRCHPRGARVACPCALSLAPLVVTASASTALARRGLLVTRADAIESLAAADTVIFDKTGTLTARRPVV